MNMTRRFLTLATALVLATACLTATAQGMTAAQIAALRADILADPVLAAKPNNGDSHLEIAQLYNLAAVPTFMVWHPRAQVSAILDTFNLAAFTPVDTILETDLDPAISRRVARLLMIQVKQMNLQIMLQGRDALDCTLPNVRAGLRDALIQVPAGVAGANVAVAGASAATALTACLRQATRAEKLFSSGSATTGTTAGNLLVYVGGITPAQVAQALAN